MKFFVLLADYHDNSYARFAYTGSWAMSNCELCGARFEMLVEPLQIQWQPGNDRIGDFTSDMGYTVVSAKVREFFEAKHYQCDFLNVRVVAPDAAQGEVVVPFPYEGPELVWLDATLRIPLNEGRSNLRLLENGCTEDVYEYKPDGLVLDASVWSGAKMFRAAQFKCGSPIYVSDEAVEELLSQGFTNLQIAEAGAIV